MIPQAITSRGGVFNPRMILAAALCAMGVFLAAFSFGAPSLKGSARSTSPSSVGSPLSPDSIGNWAIVPSPNATEQYFLGVSCVSDTDCWAIGYYINQDAVGRTLIEHWNGSAWTIVPSPNSSISLYDYNVLRGVSCTSASDCWAVGDSYENSVPGQPTKYHTLVEHWNGASWSIVPSPDASTLRNRLYDVTCATTSDCWTVGYYRGTAGFYQTLVEHWNGSAWTIVPSPNFGPNIYNDLHDITCTSATDCWAVGGYRNNTDFIYQTLTQHWNGSTWSLVASPNTAVDQANYLYSVTCASASDCWAVGYHETGLFDSFDDPITQTLIEHWNGVAWSIVSSPSTSPTQINYLLEVTCTSISQCWAVGYAVSYDEHSHQSIIERWNGSSWSIVAAPESEMAQFNVLNAVTCVSSSQCWIVGERSASRTLTEHWDGNAWSIVDSKDAAGGGSNNVLSDVTCTTTSNCWAVGQDAFGDAFVQHWDGTLWSIVSVPFSQPVWYAKLEGVACASASQCWAVGNYYNSDTKIHQTRIEHWNGTSWSEVPSPNSSAAENNYLNDVTCTSASDCWAVGQYIDSNGSAQPLIERWNGSSWSIVASPSATDEALGAVTCASSSDCWAVGSLIEHWNGTSWSIVPAGQSDSLAGVTCVSGTDCWAVGGTNGTGFVHIEHWNGSSWSVVTTPSTDFDNLEDVSCASTANCWAVGSYYNGSVQQTRTRHWDGVSWSIVSSPNVATNWPNKLHGVVCPSASACWAVGEHQAATYFDPTNQTLVERFTAGLQITSSGRSHGQFSMTGQTVANALVDIQASPNLIAPFVTIDTVTANANGVFEYIDLNSSSFQKRFYRAVFP